MKKLTLTLALITLLASLSACAPSGTENPTDTEGLSISVPTEGTTDAPTASPTEAQTEESTQPQIDVYEGPFPSSRGYRTDYILKTGDTGSFDGKTREELREMFSPYTYWDFDTSSAYTSAGILFEGFNGAEGYYDKQTGKVSTWCPDDCSEEGCIWESTSFSVQYVTKDHIYFYASTPGVLGYTSDALYRCDHDRQNVEKLMKRYLTFSEGNATSGYSEIYYVDGDKIYLKKHTHDEQFNVTDYYGVYDLSTRKFTHIPEADGCEIEAVTSDGTVWGSRETAQGEEVFCAKPDFSVVVPYDLANKYTLERSGDYQLYDVTDTHLILSKRQGESDDYKPDTVIDLDSCMVSNLGLKNLGRTRCSGKYIYYTRALTAEEMVGSPLMEYYLSSLFTISGSRLYRMNLNTMEEELLLQASYNDVPLRIEDFSVDGDVCYIQYQTYKDFPNLYASDLSFLQRFLIADFSGGTVEYVKLID